MTLTSAGRSPTTHHALAGPASCKIKRSMDVGIALIGLVLLALPILLLALAMKLSSPGPMVFTQRRIGHHGATFTLYKLRTMRHDGPAQKDTPIRQARPSDPRIGRLGQFLRDTSLDELPQLFNVLRGDMSLVGPRPHATCMDKRFSKALPGYQLRYVFKPGITGLAQVRGARGPVFTRKQMQRRVHWDIAYGRGWRFRDDIAILWETALLVIDAFFCRATRRF